MTKIFVIGSGNESALFSGILLLVVPTCIVFLHAIPQFVPQQPKKKKIIINKKIIKKSSLAVLFFCESIG